MEVSSLRQATLPGRPAPGPLLRLASDERLIALIRRGHHAAFEALVQRYQARLLSFCRHMLGSREDAEDVLQDVFAAAFNAILADEREINVRPWLYRIARNRSLNHLRRTTAVGVDSMDTYFADHGQSVPERILQRESFRGLIDDIGRLAETQRTALLLREIDALSYEQIAEVMDTTVPSVKSLLVRARVALAEAAEARKLSCEEVRLELAEVAEGLIKIGPPVRRHVRDCPRCRSFNKQLKQNDRTLAAVLPVAGLPALFHRLIATKLGSTTGAGGAYAAGSGASAGTGASLAAGAGATSGISGVGGVAGVGSGAIAAKAVAGLAAAALVTAGAVEVGHSRTVTSRGASSSGSDQGLSHSAAPTVLSSAPQIPTAVHTRTAAAAHLAKKASSPQVHASVPPTPAPKSPLPLTKHAAAPATAKHATTTKPVISTIPVSDPRTTTAHDSTSPATSQVVEVASSTVELPSSSAGPTTSSASAPPASSPASTEKPLADTQAGPSGPSGPSGSSPGDGTPEASGGGTGPRDAATTGTGGSPAPEQSSEQPAGGAPEAPAGSSEASHAG